MREYVQLRDSIVRYSYYAKKKFKERNFFLLLLLLLLLFFFPLQTVAGSGYYGVEYLYRIIRNLKILLFIVA